MLKINLVGRGSVEKNCLFLYGHNGMFQKVKGAYGGGGVSKPPDLCICIQLFNIESWER